MKCTYPGYKKYSTQNTARMQKGPGSSVERSHGEVTGLKWWWLQDPRNGHQNHIYFIYFNIMLLIYDRIMSHQLYTPDIKTNLDPRVLNFCLGFSHSTSWCFRQRRQGRTSMASSCTSNAMDCNVTMPRGVARSTGQTTSTWDWEEGNVGRLHNSFITRPCLNLSFFVGMVHSFFPLSKNVWLGHRWHRPRFEFGCSFVPRFWGAPVSWRSTCQMGG